MDPATELSIHIDGKKPGHHYIIAVNAWNSDGEGIPNGARGFVPGYGTPPIPINLQVESVDPTTVKLKWCGSPGAAGYHAWFRNVNNVTDISKIDGISGMEATYGIAFLFPGVWNFEFCVSAINGELESGKSSCVVAARTGTIGGPVGGAGCFSPIPGQVFLEMDPNAPTQGQVCVSGIGRLGNYNDLCSFTCNRMYNPCPHLTFFVKFSRFKNQIRGYWGSNYLTRLFRECY